MRKTTIQVSVEVKKMLDKFKLHPREPYDSVIRRLLEYNVDREPISEETLEKIREALEDVEAGRVFTTQEVKKELKINDAE